MKKNFFGILLAVAMVICSVGNTQVFVMSTDSISKVENAIQEETISPLSITANDYVFNKTLTYGNAQYIGLFEPFRNKENFAIVKLQDD